MTTLNLRIAEKKDQEKLETFLVFNNGERNRKLARDYIRCMFSNDYRKPTFVVAENGTQIIGAASYSEELFTVGTWGISWVSVHVDHRDQGVGQKLVKMCLNQIADEAGKKVSVILCTYPGKTKLYENIGFKEMGHDYGGGSFMVKIVGD